MSYIKEVLKQHLSDMGLTGTETIMIHSSMKSIGDAECILCDAKKLYEVTGKILKKEINCFIDREVIPSEWYM